jgi:hypothetical protein
MPGIFLVDGEGRLTAMDERPYDSEHMLQSLLTSYPDLLAGDQMGNGTPKRWLLIQRESGAPADQDTSDPWSVDHVFLDEGGMPTIVEVCRGTDSRIRREMVGRMLDHVASGVTYWPADLLRSRHDASCETNELDPAQSLRSALGGSVDVDEYWERVATNLQAGRVRMVFVAEVIPPELERVVDFLAGQLRFAEIFAIEVKQFVGGGHTALAPRLVGRRPKPAVSAGPAEHWTQERFLVELDRRKGTGYAEVASRLLEWGRGHGWHFWWGQGQRDGSCYFVWPTADGEFRPFSIWTDGMIWLEWVGLVSRPELISESLQMELMGKLRDAGFASRSNGFSKYPAMTMARLQFESGFQAFTEAMEAIAGPLAVVRDPQPPVSEAEGLP